MMVRYGKGEKIICPYDEDECDNTIGSTHSGAPAGMSDSYQVYGFSQCHDCDRKDDRGLPEPSYGWTENPQPRQIGRMCGADPNV